MKLGAILTIQKLRSQQINGHMTILIRYESGQKSLLEKEQLIYNEY